MNQEQSIEQLRQGLDRIPATAVADLLLSPHVSAKLLNESTREPGPSLWIVNRSDVSDATLAALSLHALPEIASRAAEKLRQRQSRLELHAPPPLDTPFEEIPDHSVEDLLGHPLAPFESMIFFARSLNEDHRASAALSLTRRYLEHRPDWLTGDPGKMRLTETFGALLCGDPSAYVRSYAARVPFLPTSIVGQALAQELNPFVFGRLLQNESCDVKCLTAAAERLLRMIDLQDEFPQRVLALDARLPGALRRELMALTTDTITLAAQEWFLSGA